MDQDKPDTGYGNVVKGSGFPPEDLHTRLYDRVRRAIIHKFLILNRMMERCFKRIWPTRTNKIEFQKYKTKIYNMCL